jgi:hypothetical protein
MFYPFKPGRGSKPIKSDPATDQLADRIFSRLLKQQRKCADFLNEKFKRLPTGRLKVLFFTIAIAAGSYSLFLIAGSFWGKPPESVFLRQKTQLPPTDNAALRQKKQQAFEAYLDSLEKAFIRDSINSIQP